MSERPVVLITGGAQGIGRGMVLDLLGRGYSIAFTDLDQEAAEELLEPAAPDRILFVRADMRREEQVVAALEEARQRFGRLDALVNNAAIADPSGAALEELPLDDWRNVLDTNLTGPLLATKHATQELRKSRGSIINIASTRALQSEPDTFAYTAAKGGLVALTHAMAVSLGPAVRVNAVSPGWIDVSAWQKRSVRRPEELTPADHAQHPVGRVGRPQDVAAMVAWLISAEAGFVTGQNFVVDGGMTRKMIYAD